MNCQKCGPSIHYLATAIALCWCQAELCSAHLTEHLPQCELYRDPSKAPKEATVERRITRTFKQKGFEAIGGLIRKQVRR